MQQDINFKITANSEAVEYDDLLKILHRAIDNDFMMYFKSGVRAYNCNNIPDKAEVLYDMSKNVIYWGENHEYILIESEIGGYGTYAIPNLIRDIDPVCKEDWERDVETYDMSDDDDDAEADGNPRLFTEDEIRQRYREELKKRGI